jgi:hypothetical protein
MMRGTLPVPVRLLSAATALAAAVLSSPAASCATASPGYGKDPGYEENPVRAEDVVVEDKPGIVWHDDLIDAQLEASETGRPVALYARSSICDSCDKLRDETLADESVLDMANTFTWVMLDKEADKEELAPLHVFAFPSILILGPKNENIYRFSGFRLPTNFLADLDEALRRYSLFEKGEDWDTKKPRPSTLFPGKKLDTIPLPINEAGHGITFVDGMLFVVQARNLFGFDAETLEWKYSFPLPAKNIHDICTDGTLIYALPWGWSKGDPIYAIDPATGETVVEIVTERNKKQRHSSAQGIEWVKGELLVMADMGRIYAVNPTDGVIRISLKTDTPGYGLVYNGEFLVTANQRGVHFMTLSGQHKRSVATNYPLGSVSFHDGMYYLTESEIRGFDRKHNFTKIWPEESVLYKAKLD